MSELPNVGSVWKHDPVERYVAYINDTHLQYVEQPGETFRVVPLANWHAWVASGARCVYDPQAAVTVPQETVHHLTDADLDSVAERAVRKVIGTPHPELTLLQSLQASVTDVYP